MEYRIHSYDAAAKVDRTLDVGNQARKSNRHETKKTPPLGGTWSKNGSTLSVHSNFQQFLTQETALASAGRNGKRPEADSAKSAAMEPATDKTAEVIHVVRKGDTIWELATRKYKTDPAAILRLNNIDNPSKLRVGQRIRIPVASKDGRAAPSEEVVASWYGKRHQGRLMANGEPFDMHGATIAHRDMPMGTEVELENPVTGEKARAVVTDRGPYHRGRDIDLSYGLAERLSLTNKGVGSLRMRPL